MTDQPPVTRCPICQQESCDCSPEAVREATERLEAGAEPLQIASNPTQQAAKGREQKRRADEANSDLNWLMRHPQGRRIMWRLLERCSIFENAYVRGQGRNEAMAFHLGEANVGLVYFREVMVREPDAYNLMVKENSGRLAV